MRNVFAMVLTVAVSAWVGGCGPSTGTDRKFNADYLAAGSDQSRQAIAAADADLQRGVTGVRAAEAWCVRGRGLEREAERAGEQHRPDEAKRHLLAAGDAYARSIRLQPGGALEGLSRAGLANVAFFLDDFATALREWSSAIPLTNDPDTQAWMLYRVGLCQQRLGSFEQADRTFAAVRQQYARAADGLPAMRSEQCEGTRAFTVQVATFSSSSAAEREIETLKRQGIAAAKQDDAAAGRYYVRVGPIPNFAEARALQTRVAARYPDAQILP